MRLIEELKKKYPGLTKRLENNSRQAAIRLFCLECMGGSSVEVTACKATQCPLHKFRNPSGERK